MWLIQFHTSNVYLHAYLPLSNTNCESTRISRVSTISQYTKMWIAFVALLLGVIPPTLTVTTLPTSEVDTGSFGCPSPSMEQTVTDAFMDGIEVEVRQNILQTLQCRVGECESNPATSCQDVMDRGAAVTGTYWISKCDGTTTQVYCTMDNPCGCSGTGAWMRIGLLNMSDPTQQCPSGMGVINDPRSCSRNTQPGNCASFFFDSNFQQYSRVCGRSIGYQEGSPDAFRPYYDNQAYTIDDPYFDGLSVTYGFSPRNHIWTFVSAAVDTDSSPYACPCSTTTYSGLVPPFIGNDWFCEAGAGTSWQAGVIYRDNPVWDGMGCESASTCCGPSSPRWFCKDLASSTRENIEVRACGDEHQNNEDVLIQLVELYVQ